MSERAFLILLFLGGYEEDSKVFDSKLKSITVGDITVESCEPLLYSESTVYKCLRILVSYGFVGYGIPQGRSLTYYITKTGRKYVEDIFKEDEQ